MQSMSISDDKVKGSSSTQIENIVKNNVPQPVLDEIAKKLNSVQQFDPLRESILSRMKQLTGRFNSLGNKPENIKEKLQLNGEIQQCLYDIQLIEHACHSPLLELSKTIFSLDNKRNHKATAVKIKSLKRRKNEISVDEFMARRSGLESKIFGPLNYAEDNSDNATSQQNFSQLTNESDDVHPSTSSGSLTTTNYPKRSNRFKRNVTRQRSFTIPRNYSPAFSPDHLLDEAKDENEDCSPGRTKTPVTISIVPAAESISEEKGSQKASENPELEENDELVPKGSTSAAELLPLLSARPASKKRAAAIAAASAVALDSARNLSPRKKTAVIEEENIAADEPTYCLCDQVSFGDMICCDFAQCSIEWFHFSCVGIKTKPKGKWYCPQCIVQANSSRRNASKSKHGNYRD